MTDKIEVRKIENLKGSDKVRINVEIEGYSTLYFEFEGVEEIANPGDLVVLTLLTEAMLSHRDLCLPDSITVSERLLTNLEEWQDVYCSWYTQLSKVNIFAKTSNLEKTANKYVCSLFSGGADSLYTLYKNRNDITHLLFCYGMDIQLEEKERFNDARRLNQEVADSLSKKSS